MRKIYCQICGREIYPYQDIVSADGGCKGKVIYAHKNCCEKRDYSYENLVENHKPTDCGFQWGVEFETNSRTTFKKRLQLYSWYKLICTSDCTVTEEFKSGINKGLHGAKDMLDGISKMINISDGDNIGTHANVSLECWSNFTLWDSFNGLADIIFGGLVDYLSDHFEDTIKVFGRDFGSYRRYSNCVFEHGYWLQIKDHCLEFRLAKFVNTEQYFYLLCMLKEMCLAVDKFLKGNKDASSAFKTGNKLIKIFQKRVDGTATYMRPERNKKNRAA